MSGTARWSDREPRRPSLRPGRLARLGEVASARRPHSASGLPTAPGAGSRRHRRPRGDVTLLSGIFLGAFDLGARGALYSMPSTRHPIPGPRLVQRRLLEASAPQQRCGRHTHAVTRRAVRCRSLLCPPPRTPALPFRGLAFPLCLSPSPSTPAADPALTRASPRWPSTRASARPSRAADGGPENDALSAL